MLSASPPPASWTCFTTTSRSLTSATSSRPERRAVSAAARLGSGTTVTPVPVRRPASRTIPVIAATGAPTTPTRCGLALFARMAGIATPAATTSSSTIVLTAKARERPRCRISRCATIAVSRNQRRFTPLPLRASDVLPGNLAEHLGQAAGGEGEVLHRPGRPGRVEDPLGIGARRQGEQDRAPRPTRSTVATSGSSGRAQSPAGSPATRTSSRGRSPRSRSATAPWATARPR